MTPTEYCRIELKIPNDSRALGAVRGAIQHTARHLGLASDGEEKLLAVADQLLRPALDSLSPGENLSVRIQEHPDRLEIELSRPGGKTGEWTALRKLAGIDELEQETNAGSTRLKLVKFLSGGVKAPHAHN